MLLVRKSPGWHNGTHACWIHSRWQLASTVRSTSSSCLLCVASMGVRCSRAATRDLSYVSRLLIMSCCRWFQHIW